MFPHNRKYHGLYSHRPESTGNSVLAVGPRGSRVHRADAKLWLSFALFYAQVRPIRMGSLCIRVGGVCGPKYGGTKYCQVCVDAGNWNLAKGEREREREAIRKYQVQSSSFIYKQSTCMQNHVATQLAEWAAVKFSFNCSPRPDLLR